IAKRPGARPSSAIWVMRSWRTATVLLLTAPSRRPAAPPSDVPPRRCSRRKPRRRITVGEDKAYDTNDHVAALREMNITPHVAQNDSLTKTGKHRSSAIDGRTTRHIGYRISQSCRAMSECIFGWGKQHGTMRKTKHRGIAVVGADFLLNLIAYNLVRIPKLIAA